MDHMMSGDGLTHTVKSERPHVLDAEKVLYSPLDVVLRAVSTRLTPVVRAEAQKEFGTFLGRPKAPALEFNRMFEFVANKCFHDVPTDEAYRQIGTSIFSLYQGTLIVKSIYVALRMASIEWVLKSIPKHFVTGENFGSFVMGEVAPQHWRFLLSDYIIYPSVVQGYLEAGANLLRNDTKYKYTLVDTHNCYFDITWVKGHLPDQSVI